MTNGTRHDPCIPRHWAMRCPAWTLTRTSHNRVVNKIRPNTDVASISSVLHLVWPLAQSLSSMVVPTRSQNSSWHSLWDLRGTQAPQLRQSNNTLGGSVTPTMVEIAKYLLWMECSICKSIRIFRNESDTIHLGCDFSLKWCQKPDVHKKEKATLP